MIDAHIHIVDFLQDAGEPADLFAAFDAAGVQGGVIFGLRHVDEHVPAL